MRPHSSRLGVLVALTLFISCSDMPPGGCRSDGECATGQVCQAGSCTTPATECTTGDSRPCGNDAVGACRRGTQRCVGGAFETACAGEVKPVAETCNDVDDDCDGQVDEGVTSAWFPDVDGDGYGASSATATMACARPQGFVADATDCDDRANVGANVHPGATEQCDGPGVDEDCDGTANEGCGCTNVGAMTPCCGGRGTQTCQSTGSGTMLSMCSAVVGSETCNGLDDDCDGQIDEQAQLSTDGGTTCVVGQGACQVAGTPTCANGAVVCVGDAGAPGTELCNGVDDDCDGVTDDLPQLTNPDGGVFTLALDAGTALGDGSCAVGVGTCARTGTTQCMTPDLVCSEAPGAPTLEVCNGLDDDCNGQVDEPVSSLCSVTGQTCSNGACACPSGQSVCNGACVTLSTEVCDGLDNDCDGQTDEGLRQACLADGDNDLYATNATVVNQCPDSSRAAAGFCPAGFVSPGASLGTDCAASDAAAYRQVSSRADADGDTACVGAAQNDCVGINALPGRRFASACNLTDDCNDANAQLFRLVSSRSDADTDTYCTGPAANDCVGASPLSGRRFATTCNAADDCNDASGATYRVLSTRADGDNDTICAGPIINECVGAVAPLGRRFASACGAGDDCNDVNSQLYRLMSSRNDGDADQYCSGSASLDCVGPNPLPGRRFEAACLGDDCNDASNTAFRVASVRVDGDGDMYCAGVTQSMCIGNSAPAPYRIASGCQGDDCRDTNSQATTSCLLVNQYTTSTHVQTCPQGRTEFSVVAQTFCPLGFTLSALRPQSLAGGGFCEVVNATTIAQTCNVFEGTTCRIVGDCAAN